MLREAKVELKAYAAAQAAAAVSGGSNPTRESKKFQQQQAQLPQRVLPMKLSISSIGVSIASSLEELPDAVLADRLLTLLGQIPMEKGEKSSTSSSPGGSGGGVLKPLDFAEAERRCNDIRPAKILPLTW
jgi:hypothetical protein